MIRTNGQLGMDKISERGCFWLISKPDFFYLGNLED